MPARSIHVCTECAHESAGWLGRCPGCGEWNTLVEERPAEAASGRGSARGSARRARPVALAEVQAAPVKRLITGISELDRVLGGGVVPGSLLLLGGSPGIGKSTITAMALGRLAAAGRSVLYVSGRLARVAKERGVAVVLVGHVTKEGALAGPRVLEHLVDCVLAFEGEQERTY